MKWLKRNNFRLKRLGFVTVNTAFNFKIIVNPAEFIGKHIYIEGIYEPDCTYLFNKLLNAGDCVLDVGANIGYFTLLASKLVGLEGKVFAFEALPQIMQVLEKNVKLNSLSNVVCYETAVSDKCGLVEFYASSIDNLGLSSMRNIKQTSAVRSEIPSVTIDSIITNLPSVKLVKIDVEGAEFKVLEGMKELIKRDKPYIILEVTDEFLRQMDSSTKMIAEIFFIEGYKLFHFVAKDLQEIKSIPLIQSNILAVHNNQTRKLHHIV